MLMTTFFIILTVSVSLALTLPLLQNWFTKIEIFLLFMFTSYFCQNMFYTISSPYDRISVVTEHFPFWTVRLQYGAVFAITLLWLMAVYRSKATLFKKLLATFSWILLGIIVEKTFLFIGVLRSDSITWYPSLDMFFEMLVILLTLYFSNFLYSTLKRERVI
ncbi:hypothetical protein FS935_22050 [Metabacillus litoralis]|uniref:Uncharacterized protein n=1 Tax=Metabacillus litoralis TaxID=152268 RepID=A0A5C6V911_9BACI|nr:hypothetical protein [Metabacillus litoralis]TXC81587.1 hypothetical protein FS935_22050 [Metabacillus litoralis]